MIIVHPFLSWMSNVYLLENEAGLFLVDAAPPGYHQHILRVIRQSKKDLKIIYITHAHFDHYGSAAALREQTGAKIAIHHADARAMSRGQTPIRSAHGRSRWTVPFLPLVNLAYPWLKTAPDILLEDDERLDSFGLPASILHTPGHTPGSTCLLVDNGADGPLAFTGDLVSGSHHPHLQNLYADDWSQLPESLARVQAARPAQVYPGHGSRPISGDVFQQANR